MKLKLQDIPDEGLHIEAGVRNKIDTWFRKVVQEAFQEDYPADRDAALHLTLIKTCDNVTVSGTAEIDLLPLCDRCLENFEKNLLVPLHVTLAPSQGSERDNQKSDHAEEDVNFSFYTNEEINLSEIIREMFVLEIPLKDLCSESCKGLCSKCGQNLNLKTCNCRTTVVDPRLAVLKDLRSKI